MNVERRDFISLLAAAPAAAHTHAFFTHLHYDHCMDYGRLFLQRWDQGADRIADLDVYGPPPIARMTAQLFGADGVYGPDIRVFAGRVIWGQDLMRLTPAAARVPAIESRQD